MTILSDKDFVFLRQLVFFRRPSAIKFSVEDVDTVSNVLCFLVKFGISKLSALRLILPTGFPSWNFSLMNALGFFS